MNDFTKEELEALLLRLYGKKDNLSGPDLGALGMKIKYMIDDYCDHEWGVGFGSIHSPVTYCKKCYCQKPAIPNYIFDKMMETENVNQ
jgi:hypothetical protein